MLARRSKWDLTKGVAATDDTRDAAFLAHKS